MSQKLVQSRFVTGPDDALASGDVYEVSENAIRSRAEGLSDELITELLGALKIPFDPLIDFLEDVKDFVAAILEALWDRVLDLLALLPPSIGKALGEIDITSALLGYASLNLAWDYEGELIHVDPKHGSTLQAVKDTLKKSRRAKGLDANRVPDAIDQGAETIIFTEFIKRVIASDMAPPLDEILDLISSDTIIQDVCENVFPSVFDPTGKGE